MSTTTLTTVEIPIIIAACSLVKEASRLKRDSYSCDN